MLKSASTSLILPGALGTQVRSTGAVPGEPIMTTEVRDTSPAPAPDPQIPPPRAWAWSQGRPTTTRQASRPAA